jgi:hypothetical protein
LYNFHLKLFRDNNEALIRKMHISSMIKTNNTSRLLTDITTMIRYYNEKCMSVEDEIYIEPDFPNSVLIRAMKPYLYLFYTATYALDQAEKGTARTDLKYQLTRFHYTSPTFGRKFMQAPRHSMVNNAEPTYMHDTRHTNLVLKPFSRNYDTSHVEIIEDNTAEEKDSGVPVYLLFPSSTIVPRPYTNAYDTDDTERIISETTSQSESSDDNEMSDDDHDITVLINLANHSSDNDSDDEF